MVPPPELPEAAEVGPWRFPFPNVADFNFNYYRLLNEAHVTGIGRLPPGMRVAIVGGGIAGMTAARELFRAGIGTLDIFEASDRIGGRNYSEPVPGQATTMYEMGAMRIPFFDEPGSKNCVLDYYRQVFGIQTVPFPDPHAPGVAQTGIYVNDGRGPDPSKPLAQPELLIWEADEKLPPTTFLKAILAKWSHFATLVTNAAGPVYGTSGWPELWQATVNNYWTMNFRDLVFLPAIERYDSNNPGNFGGLGMNEAQADAFYTIGAGDGSWGAFYDISALYPMRTLLFGYGTNHQLIIGLPQPQRGFVGRGVQSFTEAMYYLPVPALDPPSPSLAAAPNVHLKLNTPVTSLTRTPDGKVVVNGESYDAAILTPTTWAVEMAGITFNSFPPDLVPDTVRASIKESHWITSTKVFFPLLQRYWELAGCRIPQVIVTDTFLQDAYAYAAGDDPGALLISYTWEDDSNKLESVPDAELAARCLTELDEILLRCTNINQRISPYIDGSSPPRVFRWSRQASYRGCAKLYRERSWAWDQALLTYNQQYAASSGLYLAGEGYSVEGGWTEPALRLALDAVIHLIHNAGGSFSGSFNFDTDYPKYDTSFQPGSA